MKKGFTLLELIIVVIVIAVLAAIALPRMIRVINKARAAEGLSILNGLRESQLRYYAEREGKVGVVTGVTQGNYATVLTDLDFQATTPKFFTTRTAANDAQGTTHVGSVTAPNIGGGVTLRINADGNISCSAGTCADIGF